MATQARVTGVPPNVSVDVNPDRLCYGSDAQYRRWRSFNSCKAFLQIVHNHWSLTPSYSMAAPN